MDIVISLIRIIIGFVFLGVSVCLQMLLLILLLPSRNLRIRSCNYWGKVVGRALMWLSGCPLDIIGLEHLDADRPALYVSNHTSIFDGFLAMFLSPVGTCGVVKKQVIYYPFFGQLYLLSGHLRIDRANRQAAINSMASLAADVRKHGLSIFMWPEGTRSRNGRLLPLKKGFAHMAMSTGLPLVPVVVTGAHKGWKKGGMALRPVPITVRVLPAIDTSDWSTDTLDEHVQELWEVFRDALPEDQRPEAEKVRAAA